LDQERLSRIAEIRARCARYAVWCCPTLSAQKILSIHPPGILVHVSTLGKLYNAGAQLLEAYLLWSELSSLFRNRLHVLDHIKLATPGSAHRTFAADAIYIRMKVSSLLLNASLKRARPVMFSVHSPTTQDLLTRWWQPHPSTACAKQLSYNRVRSTSSAWMN
jgi:hypothetical protein